MTFIIHIFYFMAKVSTNKQSKIKLNETCANVTVFFLIYKVAHYLNDFWVKNLVGLILFRKC